TAAVLAGVLLAEGLVITAVFMFAGKPTSVNADGEAIKLAAAAEQEVEELVVAEKFQNSRTGWAYIYDTEIYILVRRKHRDMVKEQLGTMSARIVAEIATIFRVADPAHLDEPTLGTLKRQINATLEAMLGRDADTGDPVVERVLIRKFARY